MFYSLACTDGGYTGRSLSLVSRYVHETSKPFKLQSVCVKGILQAIEFESFLSNNPGIDHGVRHLFVSCLYPHDKLTNHVKDIASTRNQIHGEGPSRSFLDKCLIQDTFVQILHHLASNLLNLSFSVPYDHTERPNQPPIFPNFPLLTELTISYLNSWPVSGVALFFGELDHFPALKRLDLAGVEIRVPLLALFDAITNRSPCLSHLFLPISPPSHTTWAAFTCLLAFGTLEKVRSGLRDHDIPLQLSSLTGPEKIPPSLERIFVQEGVGAAAWLQVYKLIVHYEERLIFLPLQSNYDPIVYQRRELEKQWVDRMNGGEGCWIMRGSLDRMSLME